MEETALLYIKPRLKWHYKRSLSKFLVFAYPIGVACRTLREKLISQEVIMKLLEAKGVNKLLMMQSSQVPCKSLK